MFIVIKLETFLFLIVEVYVDFISMSNVTNLSVYKKRGETLLFGLGSLENASIFPFLFFYWLMFQICNHILLLQRDECVLFTSQILYSQQCFVTCTVRYCFNWADEWRIAGINVIIHRTLSYYNTRHPPSMYAFINVL